MRPVPWQHRGVAPRSGDFAWAASWASRSLRARMACVPDELRAGYLAAIHALDGRASSYFRVAETVEAIRQGKRPPVQDMEVVA